MKNQIKIVLGLILLAILIQNPIQLYYSALSVSQGDVRRPDSYWINNQGYVDQFLYLVNTNDELMLEALRQGTVDIIGGSVNPSLIKPEDYNNPDLAISYTPSNSFGQLTFNNQKFPTSIRSLRQAFAYSLDKYTLVTDIFGTTGNVADSPLIASTGAWSCEYEFTSIPCSPAGNETYYGPQKVLANQTLVDAGFYDIDLDGYREFFMGLATDPAGHIVWNGTAVAQGNIITAENGYPNPNWNGYTYLGDDGQRRTFSQVNELLGGSLLTGNDAGKAKLASAFNESVDWVDVSFSIEGSKGYSVVTQSADFIVNAFHQIGIDVSANLIDFTDLLRIMGLGDFYGLIFGYSGLNPDPSFLQLFRSGSIANQYRQRWFNSTFDKYWNVIDKSPDLDSVLNASLLAQQILWQEQPLVVLYNHQIVSVYRTDKFEGFVNIPGEGVNGWWNVVKVHLKDTPENRAKYKNFPLGGTLKYGLILPVDTLNSLSTLNPAALTVLGTIEDRLFSRNPQDLSFIPANLAYNWTIEAPYTDPDLNNCPNNQCVVNGSKFVFHLLDNVTWHDGTKFSAEDVLFSFKLIYEQQSPEFFDMLRNIVIDRITISNIGSNTTLKDARYKNVQNNGSIITIFSNSSGLFEFQNLMIPIYQKRLWSSVTNPFTFENPIPIGTGPYKWLKGDLINEFFQIRNQDYYRRPLATGIKTTTSSLLSSAKTVTNLNSTSGDISAAGYSSDTSKISPAFEVVLILSGLTTIVSFRFIRKKRID